MKRTKGSNLLVLHLSCAPFPGCVSSNAFSQLIQGACEKRPFSKTDRREKYGHGSRASSRPGVAACHEKKREKSSSRRPSSEEEEESGDRRQQVFARQDDDETVLAQRASVRGLPAMLSSTSANACKTFVNRDLNGASHFRRYAVLNSRPEELRLSNFVGKPLRLEACQEELKPITSGRSKKRPRGAIDCVFEYALEPTPSLVPRRRSVVVHRSHQCYRRYCGRSGQAFGARQNLRIGKYIRAQVRFMKLGRASKEGRADTKRRLAKPRSQCPRLSRKKISWRAGAHAAGRGTQRGRRASRQRGIVFVHRLVQLLLVLLSCS